MMPENGHPMTSRSTAPLSSTYRLQLTDHFTLHDAVNVVPYLSELGVGALYLSPLLKAVAGSQHGYDVVDHSLVDPARGGEKGLQALSEACGRAGLALVVDIVPNHMGVADSGPEPRLVGAAPPRARRRRARRGSTSTGSSVTGGC